MRRDFTTSSIITLPAEYCVDRVCLSVCVCVCLSASLISGTTRPIFTNWLLVTYGRNSVPRWRRCDTLCTSGFMDDIILAHKPRQLNVAAQLMETQPICSLGLGCKRRVAIPVAGQLTHTHGPTSRASQSGPTRPQ